jgi:hypothetical protein
VISHDEVCDWLVTLGLARSVVLARDTKQLDMNGTWITYVQERLIVAVDPHILQGALPFLLRACPSTEITGLWFHQFDSVHAPGEAGHAGDRHE